MKKIPTIFLRNPDNMREILDQPHPDCQWVFDGEGFATRKYDGTCCLVKDGKLYKRRELKKGKQAPPGFMWEGHDEVTGKTVGWVPVDPESKEDQWHREALGSCLGLPGGTYELVGPKIQGNPERVHRHILVKHSSAFIYQHCPRTFEELPSWLSLTDCEGIVFHHPDGRMAKIKKRDFGLKR